MVDTVKDSSLHFHCPGLLGDSAHLVDTTGLLKKMVLKRPFFSDTGEDCTFNLVTCETEIMKSIC